ncbi:MAG: T9SS type A sorting domain-containing protein [Bacteroidia bacterium]|nr:T9SS type A sorting domain-containing protein [Bacteroidia bacterium]
MKNFLISLILISFSSKAQSLEGQLDSTFGTNGATFSNFIGGSIGLSFKFDSNKNIIACGKYFGPTNYDFAAIKFNSDGVIDTTFANNGQFIFDFGFDDYANSVLIQNDDKIIIGGLSSTWDGVNTNSIFNQFSILRLNNNGTIDSSFGINGIFALDFDPIDCGAVTMALQSDGKIIAVGRYNNGSSLQFIAIRITTNGLLDINFGNNGITTLQLDNYLKDDEATCCLIQPDDKIVIGGVTIDQPLDGKVFGMVRLSSDGLLDPNFGINGIVKTDIPNQGNDLASAITLQSDGKIILAGTCKNSKIMAICRYNPDGTLDNEFGNQGIDTLNISLGKDIIRDVLILEDEKIIIVGETSSNACILRLKKDGQIDSTFNFTGINYFGNSTGESFNNLLLKSPNKIIATGYAKDSSQLFQFSAVTFNSLLFSGINQIVSPLNPLSIYPNPIKSDLNIIVDISINQNIIVELFDIRGSSIGKYNKGLLSIGQHCLFIDVSSLTQGIYLLKIYTPDKLIGNTKFIKH